MKSNPANVTSQRAGTGNSQPAPLPSKYDILMRPSQKLLDVGAALHQASQQLGLFKVKQG